MSDTHGPIEVYREGDELYAAMLAGIDGAKSRVRMETYIFAEDEVGKRFLEALERRAREGVRVTLRLDHAGSLFGISRQSIARMRAAGVDFQWSRRWQWRRPWKYNRRNHRKLLVIDESCAFLGGFNIHRENSLAHYGEKRWRDTHVRFGGELVADAITAFDRYGARRRRYTARVHEHAYLLANRAHGDRFHLRRELRDRFGAARRRIWVSTPYFVPDHRMQSQLKRAARRGVDVRVLLPAKSDIRIVQWAARAAYSHLLDAGVKIYEYRPRVLHAKTALVDDAWATVGTANLDYRSLFVNDELNLVGLGPELNAKLERDFHVDMEDSREMHPRRWSRRPWTWMLAEAIGWAARRWL